ncbi:tRNA preQ1(34) S-adenosylmethionine ribosyltransferase-isomerase QueA [Crassaminicella indica]|uniref:S-adenosylmethionine:tRNA ribosyltransferase-isomerase n=1 Tax=Crassaminicella indica TaxID=2855394 RepID=A0ABX8RA76_9CLOT|nr:tRNA preQ1(34) S-adenosylmethionine ribosyltransferase-isomerase QueA [Crassaminicella indica]QXM05928.1 tRNA preQ1(34) S-adenosylmethionine ribosyltransferase-isomerase QueA [Crassaminicella indica]
MKKSDFYFDLPKELIAQTPLKDRDESKLMILSKKTGKIEHKKFKDIIEYLNPGDCLVLNNTRVLPARLFGARENTGGKVEFLLLKRINQNQWETLVKPGKKAKIGDTIVFGDGLLKAKVIGMGQEGSRIIEFEYDGIFEEILDELGTMPLPPYIKESLNDKERYQTVYSKHEGSAAAPTAGLHFTKKLLKKIQEKGIKIAYVTLHVGLGTFRPVKSEDILSHKMHSEFYMVSKEAAELINRTKESGGRVISVGTTSTRVLESTADEKGFIHEGQGWTDIFIYPGYRFKVIDGLITNFHLPESTLIMLVSAFSSRAFTLNAYEEAIKNKYRFFSFGDAMFII